MAATRRNPVGRVVTRHPDAMRLPGWRPGLHNCQAPTLPDCKSELRNGRDPTRAGRPLRLTLIVLLTTAITACGWHLRGSYSLPPEITPIAVDGGGIAARLRNSLRSGSALARSSGDPAASDLEILEEGDNRRVISVNADGNVDEFEVRYSVRWQLTAPGSDDSSRRILIAPTTFRANRNFDYSTSTVLSTNEQERRLVEEMRDDIAQRILFRLQGVDAGEREAAPADAADADDG